MLEHRHEAREDRRLPTCLVRRGEGRVRVSSLRQSCDPHPALRADLSQRERVTFSKTDSASARPPGFSSASSPHRTAIGFLGAQDHSPLVQTGPRTSRNSRIALQRTDADRRSRCGLLSFLETEYIGPPLRSRRRCGGRRAEPIRYKSREAPAPPADECRRYRYHPHPFWERSLDKSDRSPGCLDRAAQTAAGWLLGCPFYRNSARS